MRLMWGDLPSSASGGDPDKRTPRSTRGAIGVLFPLPLRGKADAEEARREEAAGEPLGSEGHIAEVRPAVSFASVGAIGLMNGMLRNMRPMWGRLLAPVNAEASEQPRSYLATVTRQCARAITSCETEPSTRRATPPLPPVPTTMWSISLSSAYTMMARAASRLFALAVLGSDTPAFLAIAEALSSMRFKSKSSHAYAIPPLAGIPISAFTARMVSSAPVAFASSPATATAILECSRRAFAAKKAYPQGWKAPRPYLRIVSQPR